MSREATSGSTPQSPSSKLVPLSDGSSVEIRALGWSGYRAFKNELLRLHSGPILERVSQMFAGPMIARIVERFQAGKDPGSKLQDWTSSDTAEVMQMITAELQKHFAGIASDISLFLDAAGDILLRHSLPAGYAIESLNIGDGCELRNVALQLTDLETIWRLEKNFVGELGSKIATLLGKAKSQLPVGTSQSKPA